MTGDTQPEEPKPPWLNSANHAVSHTPASPNTAEVVAASSEVELTDGSTPNVSLRLQTDRADVRVVGDIGGGSRLTVEGENLTSITVTAPFKHITVQSAKNACQLELPTQVEYVTISTGTWTLVRKAVQGEQPMTPVRQLDVTKGNQSSVTINGEVHVTKVTSPVGTTGIDLPPTEDSIYEATGQLTLQRPPGSGSRATARKLTVKTHATTATYGASTSVTFEGGLGDHDPDSNPPADAPSGLTVVNARTVKVDGDARNTNLNVRDDITITGSLIDSSAQTRGLLTVSVDLIDSRIETKRTRATALKVGQGQHPAFKDVTPDTEDLAEAFKVALNQRSIAKGSGTIRGCNISIDGNAHISARSITDTSIATRGRVRTETDIVVNRPVKASYILAGKLSYDEGGQLTDVRRIACREILGAGYIAVRHYIVASTAASQSDPLTLRGRAIHVRDSAQKGTVLQGTVRLEAKSGSDGTPRVAVRGGAHLEDSNLEAYGDIQLLEGTCKQLTLAGPSHLYLHGNVENISAATFKHRINLDDGASVTKCETEGRVAVLSQPDADPRINMQDDHHVRVTLPRNDKQKQQGNTDLPNSRAQFHLSDGAHLTIWKDEPNSDARCVPLKISAFQNSPKTVRPTTSPKSWDVRVAARVQRKTATLVASSVTATDSAPRIRLCGGVIAKLDGTFQSLDAAPAGPSKELAHPTVNVNTPRTSIHNAAGTITLGSVHEGAIYGRSRWQLGPTKSLEVVGAATPSRPDKKQATSEARPGKLIDVDITPLDVGQLDNIKDLDAVEPTPISLRTFGRKKPDSEQSKDGQRAEQRMRAERANALLEALEDTAASGGSKAAAKWAAAKLHHSALPKFSTERLLRRFHWSVGYGQNPLPAALTLLTFYLAVVGVRLRCWHIEGTTFCTEQVDIFADWTWLSAFSNTLLQPVSLIQFVNDSGDGLFHRDVVNLVVFLAIGLPLVFLIIALKNYLTLKDD